MKNKYIPSTALFTALFTVLAAPMAQAHVKWFSDFSFTDKPNTLAEVLNPTFFAMMLLSMVVIGLLVLLDYRSRESKWFTQTKIWLDQYHDKSLTIMRAAAAAVFLLSFQSGSLFVPELYAGHPILGWIQFVLAVLLLFRKTVFISGLGMIGLYIFGLVTFGPFHMLDYVVFAGVGYYLVVTQSKNEKVRGTGLIALYSGVGFSLCWVAIEKMLYPQWSFYILEQNPQLALGLNFEFFLIAAAFVEISLGYLMIICLLQRPLALVVTLVFFMTTLIFGKTEVIGHTIIHAALIVFVIEGAGNVYKRPISFHKGLYMRIAFACVNFAILLFALLIPYQRVAMARFEGAHKMIVEQAGVETANTKSPKIEVRVYEDAASGWNIHIITENFTFTPPAAGITHEAGEGHAHLYIDGNKESRIYGPWFYIPPLEEGPHKAVITLNTNDHRLYLKNGQPIQSSFTLDSTGKKPHMTH